MLKKKSISVVLAMILLLVMALGSASAAASGRLTYTHSSLGFSLTLPPSWTGLYRIEETQNGALFINISNERAEYGGLLFGIEVYDEEAEIPTQFTKLPRSGGKYFYAVYPGDIQWAYDDAALSKEYKGMNNEVESILKTFRHGAP